MTYEQIEKWKNENDEWVLPESFEIKNQNNQVVATVNPQSATINNNELYWESIGTQQNPITLQYNENDGYYVRSEFNYPTKKVKLSNIDTSIIPSGGDPPITIDQALITGNGQFLPSDFNVQTGYLNPIDPVTGERVQSNAEYISSVEVNVPDMQLDPNQPPITVNDTYVMYDMERNDTLDVVPQNEQPQQQQRSLVLKSSTRDATDDQTYRKIGVLTVNVPQTSSKISITSPLKVESYTYFQNSSTTISPVQLNFNIDFSNPLLCEFTGAFYSTNAIIPVTNKSLNLWFIWWFDSENVNFLIGLTYYSGTEAPEGGFQSTVSFTERLSDDLFRNLKLNQTTNFYFKYFTVNYEGNYLIWSRSQNFGLNFNNYFNKSFPLKGITSSSTYSNCEYGCRISFNLNKFDFSGLNLNVPVQSNQ